MMPTPVIIGNRLSVREDMSRIWEELFIEDGVGHVLLLLALIHPGSMAIIESFRSSLQSVRATVISRTYPLESLLRWTELYSSPEAEAWHTKLLVLEALND